MTSRIFQLSALLAAFAFATTTSACPKDSKCGSKKGAATLASVKVVEDGQPTTTATKSATTPCSKSGKKVAIAALKSLTATKTAGKAGCSKPCCNKKGAATAVAAAVTTTSGSKKPCGGCSKKGAATVAAAGAPCSGKCASCPDCKKNPAGCATCAKCKSGAKTASAKAPCGKKCGTKKSGAVVSADGVKRCPLTGKPIKVEDCPIGKKVDAVLTSLPTMKYKIGDDVTCCSKSAAAMAKKSNTKMQYMVGDDVFSTEKEASAKIVAAYEMEVNNLNSMQFSVGNDSFHCPMSAKDKAKSTGKTLAYRVAGFDFSEKSKAEDALKKIALTVADVKMSYKVGDQKFCCDKMAGAKVKETGSTMSYIVGDVETTDEYSAKMKLAEAKIRAIIRTAYTAMGS